MKIVQSSFDHVTTTTFSVTKQEWFSLMKETFLDPAGEKLHQHGYLYREDRKIRVSRHSQQTNLTIDDIIKVSRAFFEEKSFKAEELRHLNNCFVIMQDGATAPRNWLYQLFLKYVAPWIHFWRGEKLAQTSTLIEEELKRFPKMRISATLDQIKTLLRTCSHDQIQSLIPQWEAKCKAELSPQESADFLSRLELAAVIIQRNKTMLSKR